MDTDNALMALGDNIKALRERKGWTTHKLAEETGVFQSNISRYESNKSRPRPDVLRAISAALNTDPMALEYGEKSVLTLSAVTHKVPLIAWEEVPTYTEQSRRGTPYMNDFLLTTGHYSDKSFALRILDDSMAPRFKPGDSILVDPEIQPDPNDYVIACLGDLVWFRQYKARGLSIAGKPSFELVPSNDGFPSLRSDQVALKICGTMVEHTEYRARK